VGAGVSLAPNGLRMLARLGAGEEAARAGAPPVATRLLHSDGRPVLAYRGLVPSRKEYPAGTMTMWVGPGQHFLVFPVRAGQLLNYVGFVSSDTPARESWSAHGDPAAHFAGCSRTPWRWPRCSAAARVQPTCRRC
jgi:hypothetical protein